MNLNSSSNDILNNYKLTSVELTSKKFQKAYMKIMEL